jgi:Cu/Ag efflux pump CusA
MNPGVFSVRHPRIVLSLIFIVIVGGILAYTALGHLEDPEFTIKQALIITPYPGARSEDVVKEVTNPIEDACQQMGQVKSRRIAVHTRALARQRVPNIAKVELFSEPQPMPCDASHRSGLH